MGGPAGRSEGEGDGEDVEEETEEWLITSTRPCRQKDTHRHRLQVFYLMEMILSHSTLRVVCLFRSEPQQL